jgi:SH3-like domain-containing protein
MRAARNSVARAAPPRRPAAAIAREGRNCWSVERADRFRVVQDAADYFCWVRQALLEAHHTVFIAGWDIQANLDLVPGADPRGAGAPTRLDELLAFVVRQRRQLR